MQDFKIPVDMGSSIKIFRLLLFIAVLSGSFSSCISHKQLTYLREDKKSPSPDSFAHNDSLVLTDYKIQRGDLVNIKVSSTIASNIEVFKQEYGSTNQNVFSEASIYLNAYEVDETGHVDMPLIGKINVLDLTTTEVTEKVVERLKDYLKFITVSTKVVSFRVTLFGEVNAPGTFVFFQKRLTIFEAIARAGNASELANLKRVKIIRKSPDGSKIDLIDLSRKDIVGSEFYFLRPNDIIYIEPLRLKAFRLNSTTVSTTLSVLTFVIVFANLFTNRN